MRPLDQDFEEVNAEPPGRAPDPENAADETGILTDQDVTRAQRLDANDPGMGSDGTSDYGVGEGDFAHGEVDVKEQMDRVTAHLDALNHRPRDPGITPFSEEGKIDRAEAIHNGMLHKEKEDFHPLHEKHGNPTGAFTDIGEGKSGVTRRH